MTILDRIRSRAEGNFDQEVPIKHLSSVPDKYFLKGRDVSLLDSAESQLLTALHIPTTFYRERLNAETQVQVFRHRLNVATGHRPFLFRFLKNGTVRAVLSMEYGIVDDLELYSSVLKGLEGIDYVSSLYDFDEKVTQIRIEFPDCKLTFPDGRELTAGVQITNSETGHSAVWIEPLVRLGEYSLVNRSSLRDINLKMIHRGKVDQDRIHSLIKQVREIAQVGLVQLVEERDEEIEVETYLKTTKRIEGFPARFHHILEKDLREKKRVGKLEAAEMVLNLARELPVFQQATVSQGAGQILGLFSSWEDRLLRLTRNQ